MKILLTGASGYIGKRLLPVLLENGHEVLCCVRDRNRFNPDLAPGAQMKVLEVDFLDRTSLEKIPDDISAAYYLLHSMSSSADYQALELKCATNFREVLDQTKAKQVIYLTGIVNEKALSSHLASRMAVERELSTGGYHLTALRAGIIIGSGSASFEIIRDLVEKLPVMIAPKWISTKCQPIGISDVIKFLYRSLLTQSTFDQSFDIGGPDILSYRQMLLGLAKVRGLRRFIYTVPVMTPRLSSYWLYFVTSTSYQLATALVNSMKVEVVCRDRRINQLLDLDPVNYQTALQKAFYKIEGNEMISSWKDAWSSGILDDKLDLFLDVPEFGCYKDQRRKPVIDLEETKQRIWRLGGTNGWYYGNKLWQIRGHIDKLFGGVGLRRGRTHPTHLAPGDALDFWRVLYADKKEGRLLLFAEMKLPGEAWLEFEIKDSMLTQTATFRPRGLSGRLYWYLVLPFHHLIFEGLISRLVR